MFNNDLKKTSIANLEREAEKLNDSAEKTTAAAAALYEAREGAEKALVQSVDLINQIKNTPVEISTKLEEIKVSMKNYSRIVDAAKADAAEVNLKAGGAMAGGVAMGVGVAAFAPTAAMGIATTFGVASTGAAISGLSGAAASSAALAWLGGGALAAGGAGMAGGEALLALAGPVGWAIGGAALLGGGLFMNGKNKKIAAEAKEKTVELHAQRLAQTAINEEISKMEELTIKDEKYLAEANQRVSELDKDFNKLNSNEIYFLGAFVNNVRVATVHLNAIIGERGYTDAQKVPLV
jgi:Txe/YoeB family toxin of Txe-Axe toxin-antitoxin module